MSSSTLSKTEVVKGRKDDMKGKNVIVTGANSGIGFALSKALVSRGAHVTVASRDKAKIAECVLAALCVLTACGISATMCAFNPFMASLV